MDTAIGSITSQVSAGRPQRVIATSSTAASPNSSQTGLAAAFLPITPVQRCAAVHIGLMAGAALHAVVEHYRHLMERPIVPAATKNSSGT
jgi:hypothetical protein